MTLIFRIAILAASWFLAAASSSEYSYDPNATNGPSHWSELTLGSNSTNECGGRANSPIAFNTSACDTIAEYTFKAGNCSIDSLKPLLHNNVVEISYPNSSVCDGNTVQLPGLSGTFAIRQFHIHTSSEHEINGAFYGSELHLVHKLVDGSLFTVIGIPIQPDAQVDNPIFARVLSLWKSAYTDVLEKCNISTASVFLGSSRRRFTIPGRQLESSLFNVYDLIPTGSTYYTYNGSLTTPPCTQSVLWNVVDVPMLISVRQFEELTAILLGYRNETTCELASISSPSGSTSRPVQPLNGRRVVRVCSSRTAPSTGTGTGKSGAAAVTASTMLVGMAAIALSLLQML